MPTFLNINERRIMDRREEPNNNPILVQILEQYNSINENLTNFKEEFSPYLDFIKEEYTKKKRRKERWDKIVDAVLGWGVVSLLTMLGSLILFIGHYFWQSIKRDIGLK